MKIIVIYYSLLTITLKHAPYDLDSVFSDYCKEDQLTRKGYYRR